ncbi:MAG: DUF5686 family protein [Lentimicrobiaceae bacterium]
MNKYLTLCLLLITSLAFAQKNSIRGSVRDSATNEPLAFVNILINNSKNGGMTDIDGYFSLKHPNPVQKLSFSYVGYLPLEVEVNSSQSVSIKLVKQTIALSEVNIIAGENPAHRIISNVIANRQLNDPKNMKSYSYTSYDKMIFTVLIDSAHVDTTKVADSSVRLLKELMTRQHLFMMESVSEHKFLYPSRHHDKVTATKVSGLKDPLFIFLLSQSQPTSFYDEVITLAGKNYINPIGPGFDKHYFFWLRDTIYSMIPGDTTYVISYKPLKGKNFDALTGLLYISNRGWAISNVIAEPYRTDESFTMRIQQMYEFLENKQWFPVQLNTDIAFNSVSVNGGKPLGIGKSYRKNIRLEPDIVKRELDNIAVEVVSDAANRDDLFWNKYRTDTLNLLEKNTYRVIDSLGKAHHLDRMTKVMTSLTSGRIPISVIDVDLAKLFRYNMYEKSYLGLGLYTNNRLSRFFSLGGYAGYGFGDELLKYGGSLQLNLMKYKVLQLKLKYSNDLEESAGTRFFDADEKPFTSLNWRSFYISRMDRVESAEASVQFRLLQYVTASAGIRQAHKEAAFNYGWVEQVGDVSVITNEHSFGYFIAGFRFAYKEKFVRNNSDQYSMGTDFPILWLQYTGCKSGFLNGNYTYNRLDARVMYSMYNKLLGKTSFMLTGGIVDHEVPYSELFNGNGSGGANFSIYAPGSFTTMHPSEFLDDHYAAMYITHSFGKLLMRTKYFEPEISVALNMGTGSLKNPQNHRYAGFSTMEKGYYETGIIINNLLKSSFSGIGICSFYRFGPYSKPEEVSNLMLRLTLTYSL